MLVRLPPDPQPCHLRTKLRAGHQRFFDGLTRLADKAPDGVMHDMHPAIRQFRRQRPHGQIGLLGQAGQNPISRLALQLGAAVSADLGMFLTQPGLSSLAHPDRRRNRNSKPLCSLTDRHPIVQGSRNPNPQVNRKW
jgi:hypothetical protein